MAIVEDEVHNDSEEENEIEVVVDEEDGDQESEIDSEDEEEVEALESKVAEFERRIAEDPYNYDEHIELIQALWGLSEVERWRAAFNQLQQMSLLKAEHWLIRIQTEMALANTQEEKDRVSDLFQQAALDCYSVPIYSEWCSWSLGAGDEDSIRAQIDEVVRRAGADPLSGKLFWDAKTELEKSHLESLSEEDPDYKDQLDRLLFCLEEMVSRPLLRGEEAWPQLEELALKTHDSEYLDKLKKQHEAAVEYLNKITPFEDKLLTLEDVDEKCKVYQDYIDLVKELDRDKKYSECDSNGLLKVLYDRKTSECVTCADTTTSLLSWVGLVHQVSSRTSYWRVLDAATRRRPRSFLFWVMKMQQAEIEGWDFDEVKQIFESALSKGMESYKEAEELWMAYLEYIRRHTAFDNEQELERLRKTFRLAWDSLAESWGAEANNCEVPLFWARLEYKKMGDPKQGKEIFEEIFSYGENKTLYKYWEALILLESGREGLSENKMRDLCRRALKFVTDYPPGVARLWIDMERECGSLDAMIVCRRDCEAKIKEWRETYQAMKDKMVGQRNKGKQQQNKKGKFSKKSNTEEKQHKGKRKAEDAPSQVKKKREDNMEVDVKEQQENTALKRTHEGDGDSEATDSKRVRSSSSSSQDAMSGSRDACTLFVSNLEFKVNEENLRKKLSEFGAIVSMRVRQGVKAFGGSICYCQYKTPESVEKALKHDRTPLDGRPMFLSRYSSTKGQKTFKYSTTTEKNKLFVRNLPFGDCTKEALEKIFSPYGKLQDIRVVTHKDGKPKGLAYIEYEQEASAAQALEKTNGMLVGERKIDVAVSAPPPKGDPASATLGQAKRDVTGGMRRTQLSSFVPSSVIRASTSQTADINGGNSNEEKKKLSNSDFRSMLLKK